MLDGRPALGYWRPMTEKKPKAGKPRDEARQALSGNLCRCGAYDHYLNAVMRAAETGERVSQA